MYKKYLFLFFLFTWFPLCNGNSYPLVGFCWISNPSSDLTMIDQGFRMAHSMGCQIEHRQYNWKEIEKDENVYDWSLMDKWYTACQEYNIVPSLVFCSLNSNSIDPMLPDFPSGYY